MIIRATECGDMVELNGVIPANILPLHDDLSIDEAAYRAHIRSLAEAPGVVAVTCNGHAAEVTGLDRTERRRAVALAVAAAGGRVPIIAGVHADNHARAIAYARDAEAEGAAALLVFPLPMLALGGSQEMGYRHVAELASAVTLPLVVFSYPEFTGMAYDLDALARICAIPTVTAVKEWTLDLRKHEQTRDVLAGLAHPVSLLTSFSMNLLPALASGADGILSGHGSVIAGLQAGLFAAVRSGDLEEAARQYARIQILTKVIYRAPLANMYARMKEHLIMLGAEMGPAVRAPLERIGETERHALRQALADARLLPTATR